MFLLFLKRTKIISKFSLSKLGGEKIKSDYSGLKWYCSKKKLIVKKSLLILKKK